MIRVLVRYIVSDDHTDNDEIIGKHVTQNI